MFLSKHRYIVLRGLTQSTTCAVSVNDEIEKNIVDECTCAIPSYKDSPKKIYLSALGLILMLWRNIREYSVPNQNSQVKPSCM